MPSLQVTIHVVKDLKRRLNVFDKLDPYVVITCGEENQKTAVKKDAGRQALFGETFTFSWDEGAPVTLTVYDQDKGMGRSDDELCKVYVDNNHLSGESWHGWLQLTHDGDNAGQVLTTFVRWH